MSLSPQGPHDPSDMAPEPLATVVITTKDRWDALRTAVQSALEQDAQPEVLVVDDGSTDGTAEHVQREFPSVRLHRNEESMGLIAARNFAATLARGKILFSIDDDAAFSTPYVVSQTLEEISAPGVAAVAIPHVDVNREGAKQARRAPDGQEIWVTATFVGTAYAIRRDVFLALGGFREDFVHQGEEPELSLRMLHAGWWCRVGRADVIHHYESPHRDMTRMDLHGRKNELLHAWTNVPWPWAALYLVGYPAKGVRHGFRVGRPRNQFVGIWRGLCAIGQNPDQRKPVSRHTMQVDRRLRREGMLPLTADGRLGSRSTRAGAM